ncbi:MAG: outer membrane lipoprotein-sorting protein [Opitutales bacterium]|nr:outer membrane lipoprotein-sorting protein [Opitutales bacterium]
MKKLFGFFCLGLMLVLAAAPADAQRARRADTSVRPLTREDADQRWAEFLASRPARDYAFKFELSHMPRKSPASEYEGYFWGKHFSGDTFFMRLKIWRKSEESSAEEFLFVSENGECKMFKKECGKPAQIPQSDWFKPLLAGLVYTPFDFAAPYKKWAANYAGPGRVGRAVHFFDMRPGGDFARQNPQIKKVRVALSREFNAPFYTEYYGEGDTPSRSMLLDSIKKIGDIWFMKEMEMQDKATRDKDKMKIAAVKFDELPIEIFSEKSLEEGIENPILDEI